MLYKVTIKNAPKFHVVIDSTIGYKVWGVTVAAPADSPNTDGIDPSRAKNGVIAYTKISTGDDNIAVKGGGPCPVDGLLVAHNHFGEGHGMSIGSETNGGVRNVSVCDLSLDGTDNGLRIKSDASRGGLVQGIYYTDVCIRDSRHPLVFDAYYSSSTGTSIPDYRDIVRQQRSRAGHGRPEHVPWLGRRPPDRHHAQQRRLRQRAYLDHIEQCERRIWARGRKHQTGGDGRQRDR